MLGLCTHAQDETRRSQHGGDTQQQRRRQKEEGPKPGTRKTAQKEPRVFRLQPFACTATEGEKSAESGDSTHNADVAKGAESNIRAHLERRQGETVAKEERPLRLLDSRLHLCRENATASGEKGKKKKRESKRSWASDEGGKLGPRGGGTTGVGGALGLGLGLGLGSGLGLPCGLR